MENKMIGITETYDPCFVSDWDKKLLDANIIISKELTHDMIEKLAANQDKIIFHHTVTGLGESIYEPKVKNWNHERFQASKLFNKGFPKSHYVLRIDPIVPCIEGINGLDEVLYGWSNFFCNALQFKLGNGKPDKMRCRISILDMYNHVRFRLMNSGVDIKFFSYFTAPKYVFEHIQNFITRYTDYFDFECCAEPNFTADFIKHIGCASNKDLQILGLPDGESPEKPQRRTCLCLAKKQILGVKPRRCPHQCLYCFWKD